MTRWRCVPGDGFVVRHWEDGTVLYHRATGDTFLTDAHAFSVYAECAARGVYPLEPVSEEIHRELVRCRLVEPMRPDAGS